MKRRGFFAAACGLLLAPFVGCKGCNDDDGSLPPDDGSGPPDEATLEREHLVLVARPRCDERVPLTGHPEWSVNVHYRSTEVVKARDVQPGDVVLQVSLPLEPKGVMCTTAGLREALSNPPAFVVGPRFREGLPI